MEQQYIKHIIYSIAGVVLVISGILLAVFYTVPQSAMQTLPFVLGGYGILSLISGISGILAVSGMNKDENFAKQVKDFQDERADLIDLKTKAKVNEFTNWLFLALIVFMSVMQVHLAVFLVFVGAFFLRMFVSLYLVNKYNKEI